jgi:MFS family permease
MAGFLPFAFFIAYGVMSIPSGFLLEKWGEKKMMITAFALAFAAALLFALFPRFNVFVVSLSAIGTGMAVINDPYNRNFFEVIASNPATITWKDLAEKSAFIFAGGRGRDYLQPGSLTAILHKILDEEQPACLSTTEKQ